MAEQCKDGKCLFQVSSRQDGPGDPTYPVVVCPLCMTRWFGYKDTDGKILNPQIPDALRDAILLDQLDRVVEILKELGFSKRPVVNALLSLDTAQIIPPNTSAQIIVRPQTEAFKPIYFVTMVSDFIINEVRIGNRSQFIHASNVPSDAFLAPCDFDFAAFRVTPGSHYSGELKITMTPEDAQRLVLPEACSAFDWDTCQTAMDVVVVVTNASDTPRRFDGFILGKVRRNTAPMSLGLFGMPVN